MNTLTHTQIDSLRKYRLSTEKSRTFPTIAGVDLLDPERLTSLLKNDLKMKLNTDKHNVLGSMLVKSYAFLAALVLYSMSIYNKGLDSSLQNLSIQTDDNDPFWLPSFYFENLDVTTPQSNRDEWRSEVLQTLFLENIAKVITVTSKQTRVSKMVLWENISGYIFWMYESSLQDTSLTKEQLQTLQEDFDYIITDAPPHVFGVKSRNPLTQFYRAKSNDQMRKTCCLFYLTSKSNNRCQNCPIACR